MKIKLVAIAVLLIAVTVSCQQNGSSSVSSLNNSKDSLSYAIGLQIGNGIKSQNIDIDVNVLKAAFETAYNGEDGLLEVGQTQAIIQAAQQAAYKKEAEDNKAEGEAFLAANKTKDGIVTTESGLQYKVIKEGNGPKPKATDKIKAHYKGTLIDGTQFDSSYDRGEPAVFPVNQVIKGWTEALQLMPVGSTWELYIPSDLGYGTRGGGQKIGPNATLIFTVELISIEK